MKKNNNNNNNNPVELFTVDEKPFGRSFSHWIRDWWKWVLETPASKSPMYGYNGSMSEHPYSDPYQPHPDKVWFLAGVANDGSLPYTFNLAHRYVLHIPQNKALLLPIINYVGIDRLKHKEGSQKERQHLSQIRQNTIQNIDDIDPNTLSVTINSQKIENNNLVEYRSNTEYVFTVSVHPKDNISKLYFPRQSLFHQRANLLAFGDGYWLFFKPPLPVGTIEINSFGACLAGKIQIGVNYKLEVIA